MTKERRSGLNNTALLFRMAVTNDADPALANRRSKRLDKSVSRVRLKFPVVQCATVLVITLASFECVKILRKSSELLSNIPSVKGATNALPSCEARRVNRKVFLDVGSNRGDVIEAFFEGKHRPDSTNPGWKFDVQAYDPNEWHVFGFEASSNHNESLEKLEQKYNQTKILHPIAVWNSSNETLTLSVDDSPSGLKNAEWGTSAVLNWTAFGGKGSVVETKTIDFAVFMKENVCPDDLVYMKMNIEAAEFVVVKHLMREGLLCYIDHVDMYWHPSFMSTENEKQEARRFIELTKSYFDIMCDTKLHVWSIH